LLTGLVSGCMGIAGGMAASATTGALAGSAFAPAATSPSVLCSTPDSITVGYFGIDPDGEREAALRLVADHCGGAYTETQTVDRGAWHAVDARCSQPDGSAEPIPPCAYDPTEPVGFSESGQPVP
jgi:hypothetical protein